MWFVLFQVSTKGAGCKTIVTSLFKDTLVLHQGPRVTHNNITMFNIAVHRTYIQMYQTMFSINIKRTQLIQTLSYQLVRTCILIFYIFQSLNFTGIKIRSTQVFKCCRFSPNNM